MQTLALPVEFLRLGLYVSRLDRPWIETPFLFQGFALTEEQEIAELRKLCKLAYVDVSDVEADELQALMAKSKPATTDEIVSAPRASTAVFDELSQNLMSRRHLVPVKDSVPLKTELASARTAHKYAKEAVAKMLDQLRRGRGLDVPHIESVVDPMVDSVLRNRDALTWLASMRTKDDYLYSHSLAASVWAMALGRHLGLDKDSLKVVGLGAMLLDIGKTQLPTELLSKPTKPNTEEWKLLRQHVERGLDLVRAAPGLDDRVVTMIATHHERFDGGGYPRKLKGDAIPMAGRIGGIVDCYDAMTSARAYAKAKSTYDAVRDLKRLSDVGFQGELIELFIQAVGVFPTGTLVELNTGEVGVVVGQNRFRRLRPEIMMILDPNKALLKDFVVLDLQDHPASAGAEPTLWITHGLEPGAYGIDPAEYFF